MVLAQEEARTFQHDYIGTEHVLLGLIREEEGLAARVLESLGITLDDTRTDVLKIVGQGERPVDFAGQIPFTPRGKKILELALREALSLGHNYIGTEHILLGMVREDEGVASRILLDRGVDAEKVRKGVIRSLSGPGARAKKSEPSSLLDLSDPAVKEALKEAERTMQLEVAAQTLKGTANWSRVVSRAVEAFETTLSQRRKSSQGASQLITTVSVDLSADERLELHRRLYPERSGTSRQSISQTVTMYAEELLRDGHTYRVISSELL